jgi:hypothetical protein
MWELTFMVAHAGSARNAANAAVTKTNRSGRRICRSSRLVRALCESGAESTQSPDAKFEVAIRRKTWNTTPDP